MKYCKRTVIDNEKVKLDHCPRTRVSQMLTLPYTQSNSTRAESAQDLTRLGPESVAPNVSNLPEGQTECITVGLRLQPPKCSGYISLAECWRRRHVNGWDSSLLVLDTCNVANYLWVSAARSLHGQRQQRSETHPTRCGHLLWEMNNFSETPIKTIFWP